MASMNIILAVMWKDLEKASGDHQSCARTLNGPWLLFVSKSGLEKQDPFEQPSNIWSNMMRMNDGPCLHPARRNSSLKHDSLLQWYLWWCIMSPHSGRSAGIENQGGLEWHINLMDILYYPFDEPLSSIWSFLHLQCWSSQRASVSMCGDIKS